MTGIARKAREGLQLVPWVLFVLLLSVRITNPPILSEFRNKVFDLYQRAHPRRAAQSGRVRIVDIDDESLRRLGQWPWPRTRVAELIDRLREQEAAVIALDIVFAEPDRTSPSALLDLWPQNPETDRLHDALRTLPDHDRKLAEAIRRVPVVTGFSLTAQPSVDHAQVKAGFAQAGEDSRPYVLDYPGVVRNLPIIEEAASGNGHFNLVGELEFDGVVRRVPILLRQGELLYPALVAEALRVVQGASTYVVKTAGASGLQSFGAHTGIAQIKIGRWVIPTDPQGRVWVYYRSQLEDSRIPVWKVLDGTLPAGALKGAIVFVGTSASGLRDLRATPLDPVVPGIDVHAQLAEQILDGRFLQRPDWADGAEIVFLFTLSALLLFILPRLGAIWSAGVGFSALVIAIGGSWLAFVRRGWLLDPIMPALSVLAIYLAASLANFLRTEKERRHIRDAFGRYLSPVLVERLAQHPELLRLGGQTRPMSILFADIRDFTTLSEKLDAEALTCFMNRFLTPMTQVVLDHGGTIDKYIGDCLMAFWNAPLDDPAHARHACEAALGLQRALEAWNSRSGEPVKLGIGISTGSCCVGNIGSEQRFDYSVLGDTVNLASRLEGLTKPFGAPIVVDEPTAQASEGLAVLELDQIVVKGKTQPVRIFALLGDREVAQSAQFKRLHAEHAGLLTAYRAREWARVRTLLKSCRSLVDGSWKLAMLYDTYEARVRNFETNPPPPDWQGVWTASTK